VAIRSKISYGLIWTDQFCSNPAFHNRGLCASAVYEHVKDFLSFYADISQDDARPVHRNEFFASEINGFLRKTSLLSCRAPQRAREGGDYNGSEGCDTPVMALDKLSRTSKISTNRGTEGAWISFGGGAGVCIFVLFYAALKDWRDGTLSQNKSSCQKYKKG
jgi:hypothetical protein